MFIFFFIIIAEISGTEPFSGVIACIGSTSDVNMQTDALNIVNGMIATAPSNDKQKQIFNIINARGIHKVLQRQINTKNPKWKDQIFAYQTLLLSQYEKLKIVPYDKTNSEHEAILMKLWHAVFPDQVCFIKKYSFYSLILIILIGIIKTCM